MTEPLLYQNKVEMNVEPFNITMSNVVTLLRKDLPVVVILEPGDATRYTLMLTPCGGFGVSNSLGHYGIRAASAHHYLLVTRCDNERMNSSWICLDGNGEVKPYMTEHIGHVNGWSAKLIAWWLDELRQELS